MNKQIERAKEKLSCQFKTISKLLETKQPDTKEIGQVWQIIPNDKMADACLGLIIDSKEPETVVMLNNTFRNDEIAGNEACLIQDKDSHLHMPVIAAWWVPFKVAYKAKFGRFICNLKKEIVDGIISAVRSETAEPVNGRSRLFRANCESQALKLGFPVCLAGNHNSWVVETMQPANETMALAAKSSQEKQFAKFQKRLHSCLVDNSLFVQSPLQNDSKFFAEFTKDLSLSFFDSSGNLILTLNTQKKRLNFSLDEFNKELLKFNTIKIF